MKDANMVEELTKILGKSTGTLTNDSQPDQHAEPWGPQGEGEWVEVTEKNLKDVKFPCYVRIRDGRKEIVVAGMSEHLLVYKWPGLGDRTGQDRMMIGDYVWVPADEPAPTLIDQQLLDVSAQMFSSLVSNPRIAVVPWDKIAEHRQKELAAHAVSMARTLIQAVKS